MTHAIMMFMVAWTVIHAICFDYEMSNTRDVIRLLGWLLSWFSGLIAFLILLTEAM